MQYQPRKRLRVKWRVAIPFFTLLFLIGYLLVHVFFLRESEDPNAVTICDFSAKSTVEKLHIESESQMVISDYFFYGENLNLRKAAYHGENDDEMIGKTVKLVNLCSGEPYLFNLDNKIDHQINVSELPNGFYELYYVYNLSDQRIVMDRAVNEVFHTMTRNSQSKKVELIADNNYTKQEVPLKSYPLYLKVDSDIVQHDSLDIMLDPAGGNDDYGLGIDWGYQEQEVPLKSYPLYLKVDSDIVQHDSLDIMLDPAGGNDDYGLGIDWGYQANGLNESDEMYSAALALKERLEKYGLIVGITKDSANHEIDTYGVNGRLAKAYNKHAKLYINLQFNSMANTDIRGMEIIHSSFSSSQLANTLMYDLKKNVNVVGSTLYTSSGSVDGVISASQTDCDNGSVCDDVIQIRESGGKATKAGECSENARNMNAFAKGNVFGMQALLIKFGYISNAEDVAMWKDADRFSALMDEIARSIAASLKVVVEE